MQILSGIIADVALDTESVETGPALGVWLTEPPDQQAGWVIDVFAQMDEGKFMVGRVITTPARTRMNAGLGPSRLVACACAPGVRQWYIQISSERAGQTCDVALSTQPATGAPFGAFKVESP